MRISAELAKDLFFDDAGAESGFEVVSREFFEERRWFNLDEVIIRELATDKYFSFTAGNDGEQGYCTLDDVAEVPLTEVWQTKKIVTEWVSKRPWPEGIPDHSVLVGTHDNGEQEWHNGGTMYLLKDGVVRSVGSSNA